MSQDMMEKIVSKFPFEEAFVDYSGHDRRFRISMRKMIAEDFYLEAEEISPTQGYSFEVYSAVYSAPAVGSALGKLRNKIRKGLSTRYLYSDSEHTKNLMHDELSGRISNHGIIVDGALLLFKDLERILITHEGFQISIVIRSAAE